MWLFFGLGTLAVVLLLFAWRADPVSRLDRELAAREPLKDAEMVSRFFAAEHVEAGLPIRVRWLFAEHTGLPAERLHPDDNLALHVRTDMIEFALAIETEFGIELTEAEAERSACTIRVVSMLVAFKHAERGTAEAGGSR